MTTEIFEQGTRRLAVSAGPAGRGAALGRILGLKAEPGWVVSGGGIREWRFEAVTGKGDQVFLHGPWFDGRPLSAVASLPLREALPFLALFVGALEALRAAGTAAFPVQTDAVLLAPQAGEVLFLPPAVVRELRAVRPFEENRETFEAVNHPDAAGWPAVSFGIAAILYRIVTGRFPFDGQSPEEVHGQARSLQVPPPAALAPGLSAEASALIMAGLGREMSPPPDLARWSQELERWQRDPPWREIARGEQERLRGAAEVRQAISRRSFRRREFWRTRWKLVAVIAAVVAALGIAGGSILSRALAPRPTAGLGPRQVTESFYRAMNGLDHQLMEACVVDRAGKEEIAEVTGIYVISRVTTAYEGRPGVLSAEEWDRDGRPVLEPTQAVYGVTDLVIAEEEGPPTPVFRVDYVKWAPLPPPDDGGSPSAPPEGRRFAGTARTDRVRLRRDRGDWVISRIERLDQRPLGLHR